ncbi:ubiquitin-related domain-containing protein [Fimicolochytrium jonesii]|uniref:ubiquitin-related domain-containing protein n=1 Tax=Fimicolochytrium jonesii TaxID=1396493 RepID=UPI0022FE135F|nr:ubiquitin-related domain-containing protein [Fimicolochytrium jonesii]KAI8816443.1 ubiquitin-related domain-containing protein [Fimicolochytrium jonesii]
MTDNQEPQENKPETVQHINLKVISNDGAEIAFKIKRTTPLERLIGAYVQKAGQDRRSVRFLYEGARIEGHETPDEMEMEDNDIIQVMVEQVGGCC